MNKRRKDYVHLPLYMTDLYYDDKKNKAPVVDYDYLLNQTNGQEKLKHSGFRISFEMKTIHFTVKIKRNLSKLCLIKIFFFSFQVSDSFTI